MYEKLVKCPSCSNPRFSNYLICQDHAYSKESFALVKCDNCQLVFTNPRPDTTSISSYYQSEEYISHTNKSNSIINIIYKLVRNYTLHSKYQLIKKFKKGKRVLDYGAGTGHFIKYMANKKWNAFAYEPHIDLIKHHQDDIECLSDIKQLKATEKFDVITAWHVIEHVHELKETIKLFRKRLNKGGYIFIAVPNINSHDAKIYQEVWAGYDVPRHLYHFNRESFKSLANKMKLNIVKIYPMKFDSFYVSLLSEKYLGSNNVLNAIKVGLKSNRLANRTGEYSSLIYVLKG